MLKSLLPDEVKLKFKIDIIRLGSDLTSNKTIRFTEKTFFYKILCFIESHSGLLGDVDGYIQLIPGTYKSGNPHNITGVDKDHLKSNCIYGSIVNIIQEPIWYSFGLTSLPDQKL